VAHIVAAEVRIVAGADTLEADSLGADILEVQAAADILAAELYECPGVWGRTDTEVHLYLVDTEST
jgi:hypothetical protein